MRGRPRESPTDSATTRYRGADGRWHARVTVGRRLDGERDRRHISRRTKRELDAAIRDLENARDSGQQPWLLDNVTVEQWVEHWLDEILPLAVRWKTRSGYVSHMRVHVIPFIGAARLTDLRPEMLERLYRELLDRGRSTQVVHGVHRTLRSCLAEAVRRQRILSNPVALARPPRVERTEIEPLNVEECRAVLTAAQGRFNGSRWSVALSLGLRQGEALGLLWDDIDLDAGILHVRRALQRRTWMHGCSPRTRKEPTCGNRRGADCPRRRDGGLVLVEPKTRASRRSVALPTPLVAELRAHRAAQNRVKLERANVWDHTLDLVFSTDWGIPVDPAADQREWKQLLRDAGVREVRLHDARHTAATLLLLQGVDVRTVMAIMGWTEMATAQRYVHAVDELRHEAARRMGSALWGSALPKEKVGSMAPYAANLDIGETWRRRECRSLLARSTQAAKPLERWLRVRPTVHSPPRPMQNAPVREAEVRDALLGRLRQVAMHKDSRWIPELNLCQSEARIDLAAVGQRLMGWEIKTAADTLERLPAQQEVYSRIFDRLWLVADVRHVDRGLTIIPPWWGVFAVSLRGGSCRLTEVRRSRINRDVDLFSLVRLLWRQEVLEELEVLGLADGLSRAPRRELWVALASASPKEISPSYLRGRVRSRLRSRQGWRPDVPHMSDGDWL